MADNVFLTAKEMAQDLVRARVEPGEINSLSDYLREHKEEGVGAFLDYVRGAELAQPLKEACDKYLAELKEDPDAALDLLVWSIGFVRYYRGEGNRPQPNRRPSEPQQRRAPTPAPVSDSTAPSAPPQRQQRRPRTPQEVAAPIASLKEGQQLQGVVRRIMPYGVFVDVGSERDGLVHISELQEGFTGDPTQVVNVDDKVTVWVKSIDLDRQRISLSMKGAEPVGAKEPARERPQQQRAAPRRPRSFAGARRSNRPEGARLFEDDSPKEMTALGEALRLALEEKETGNDHEDDDSGREKKQDHQSEELAEAQRRTLYG